MSWNTAKSEELFQAILSLNTVTEAKRFFRDLLTEEEIIEFAKRWEVAQMLDQQIPYTEIQQKTALSSTTIARISKWLKNGMGGYQLILNRMANPSHLPPRPRKMAT